MLEHSLDERYEIKGVLGKGGMGIVYHAYDNILDIDVAIKMLRSDLMGQAAIRLQREAIAAGKLQNPNIARIFDFGQTADSTPYMVMELVSGRSLAQLIQAQGPIPYEAAIRIFMQICQGLEHAHANAIVHRDLKPSNVMLVERDYGAFMVKLLDFGVAKIETDQKLTAEGSIIGSPLYMSPEQVETSSVNFKSDIYSLGCLMFETLSGQLPFKGETSIETMSMHKKTAPPLLSEIAQNIFPEDLVKLVDDCLQKMPEKRPGSAYAIEARLRNILHPVISETSPKEIPKKIYRPETEAEKRFSKLTKSTVFTIGGTLTLAAVIALSMSFSYFEKKGKAEFEEATKSKTSLSRTSETVLNKKFNANPNFEFGQFGGKPAHSAKKESKDEDLKDLRETNYPVLKIKKGHITGTGLKYLTKNDLEWLEIRNPQFICSNVKYLKSFKCLKKYVMSVPELQDENLKELAQVKTLEDITITVGDITDKGVIYLSNLPNLKRLEISNCPKVSPDIGKKLASIRTLTYFTLPGMQSQQSLKAISSSQIKEIGLNGLCLSGAEFTKICSALKPESLCISNMVIKDQDYSGLEKLAGLKKLDFTYNRKFTEALMLELTRIKVPEIDFTESRLEPAQLQKLLLNPNLKKITCNFCRNLKEEDMKKFIQDYKNKWNQNIQAIKLDFDQFEINDMKSKPFRLIE
ncbi:MAG: protein kinase [Candidatus Melainabacteria bacterium]|nr:protein kinase [Candidatus Melainabacteria bacterium]